MSETAQIVAWCVSVQTSLTVLIGGVVTAWIRLRKNKSEDHMRTLEYSDARAREAQALLLTEWKSRLSQVEGEAGALQKRLTASQGEHMNCMVEQEKLRGDLKVQETKIKSMEFQLERLWKHDENNQQQNRQFAAALDEKTQQIASQASQQNGVE